MKKIKIAINGFGRIGRAAFRILALRDDVEIVAINDLTDNKTLAYLLQHDSVFRRYEKEVSYDEDGLIVDNVKYDVFANPVPRDLPWKELEVDVVLECTGRFVKNGTAYAHIEAGAKKVILSAPAKGDTSKVSTCVIGVSDLETEKNIISNASCTTNSVAPVAKVINDVFGIKNAMMTTIHSYTSTQKLQDGPGGDLRKSRAAAQNIIPTTTGAAIAATEVIPSLKGRFDGMAVRVPTINVSLSDFTFVLNREVTVEEVNNALIEASSGYLNGVLGVSDEPLVSSDFIGCAYSGVVDLEFTKVVGGDMVKVLVWYDNEWGYANRFVDMAINIGESLV